MKNFYSAKTIEEHSKALDIELIEISKNEILKFKTKVKKHENYSNKLRAFFYISVAVSNGFGMAFQQGLQGRDISHPNLCPGCLLLLHCHCFYYCYY